MVNRRQKSAVRIHHHIGLLSTWPGMSLFVINNLNFFLVSSCFLLVISWLLSFFEDKTCSMQIRLYPHGCKHPLNKRN